jgi:hypothetical protein
VTFTPQGIDWMKNQGSVRAIVTPSGRWIYHVSLVHGILGISSRTVLGPRRAERVAKRMLHRYEAKLAREEKYGHRVFTSEPRDCA